ncbi:hypothetical protein C7E25_11640 [Stenotrophomonas maltophilia]|nr:hypothetical protein C7E25_11640 [Stenotrophomonas maltophilia]
MQELIPITLFICIAYAIHAIADARARSKLVAPHVPEEVIRSLAVLEEERRRQGALRWGMPAPAASWWLRTCRRK